MKVSVILTTYNRARVLSQTIDMILRQTLREFELIISDNCSPDDTEAIGRKYEKLDSRVRYRRNDRNLYMPGNLNTGIREARGEYVANLHDDDIYQPSLLEKWAGALDTHPSAAFVFNAYRALNPRGEEVAVYREPLPPCFPGSLLIEEYFRRWQFGSPVWGTVMARRTAYETVGLFDSRFGFFSDVDMWLRLASRFDVAYVDEPLISIPSRESLPRSFQAERIKTQRILERMWLEARVRQYSDRPARLALEGLRHLSHVAAARAWIKVLDIRRSLLRRSRGNGTVS